MLVPTRLSPNRASDGFQVTNVLERGLGKLCSLVPQRLMFVLYFAVMLLPLPAETTGSCEVFTNLQLWTFPFITLAASLFAGFSLGFHWGWSERDFSHQFLIYGSAQEFLVALVLNVICRSMKVPCGVFWPLAMLSQTFRERFAVSLRILHTHKHKDAASEIQIPAAVFPLFHWATVGGGNGVKKSSNVPTSAGKWKEWSQVNIGWISFQTRLVFYCHARGSVRLCLKAVVLWAKC